MAHSATPLRTGLLVLPQPGGPWKLAFDVSPGNSAGPNRSSLRHKKEETTEPDLVDGNAAQQVEVVEKLSGAQYDTA